MTLRRDRWFCPALFAAIALTFFLLPATLVSSGTPSACFH